LFTGGILRTAHSKQEYPMFTNSGHVIADPRLYPSDLHAIAGLLDGLTGAILVIAIVGGLIGFAAAWIIDWLPAGISVPAGIIGIFFILTVIG
jgi:hypothetical protein